MGNRKLFRSTELTTPGVLHTRDENDKIAIQVEAIPPKITQVNLGNLYRRNYNYDFGKWYDKGIDQIAYACQIQIERFIAKQDSDVSILTIRTYCHALTSLLQFAVNQAISNSTSICLDDINRDFIDCYIGHLLATGNETLTQKNCYQATKAVLKALCQRGLIKEVASGDIATFPKNPYPGVERTVKSEKPLSKRERISVAAALHQAIKPLFNQNVEVSSNLLANAFLLVALYTGSNTFPLFEMNVDCLRPHPKESMMFLVLFKRRGHKTTKTPIQNYPPKSHEIECLTSVKSTVIRIIQRVIELTASIRASAPAHLREYVWLFPVKFKGRGSGFKGDIRILNDNDLSRIITLFVNEYKLTDADGNPLRLNVSRLRKSFSNRIYELLDGDIASTAVAMNDTVETVEHHYLQPGENALKNWRFMGAMLVSELVQGVLGATENTPVGRCSDVINGQFAQSNRETPCMSFLNCLRCRNYVVTGDDLYRLFSFYWRILRERARMSPKRWKRQLSNIIRLIDRDVIEVGIKRGVFKRSTVEAERARAKENPHPFWRDDQIIAELIGGLT